MNTYKGKTSWWGSKICMIINHKGETCILLQLVWYSSKLDCFKLI